MATESIKPKRKPASRVGYVSPNQLVLPGFETPFEQQLTTNNRWVKLSNLIPWDRIVSKYDNQFKSKEGRPPINGRIVLGSVIIKHMLDLTDEETINQISENMFMQYFLGYSSFTNEAPFDSSLFVDIRSRLTPTIFDEISLILVHHNKDTLNIQIANPELEINDKENQERKLDDNKQDNEQDNEDDGQINNTLTLPNQGKLIMDATVCPQGITFPTDIKVLGAARVKSEELIDRLYAQVKNLIEKPRTYRELARKDYLNAAKKKSPSTKELNNMIGKQLQYLIRNINAIKKLINLCEDHKIDTKLSERNIEYIQIISKVYNQQEEMHRSGIRTIENRIVNIHQSYVRPIVRGKAGKKTEFGSKIQMALVNGFAFVDRLDWENFNEGKSLKDSVEKYRKRFGYYPKEVLGDTIYGNRENRSYLKSLGIEFKGKKLGRPSKDKALSNQVSPGERNPIEGKFGQAKLAYGMDRIRAKLQNTSESWVSSIVLVLNLVRLMRLASSCLFKKIIEYFLTRLFVKKIELSV